jgi:hypothetical protein
MADRRLIPQVIRNELDAWGITISEIERDGTNHARVVFPFLGRNMKWSVPREGSCDPRAVLNCRSQLRHHLRRVQNGEATGR